MRIVVLAENTGLEYGISGSGGTIEEAAEKFRESVMQEIEKSDVQTELLRRLLA